MYISEQNDFIEVAAIFQQVCALIRLNLSCKVCNKVSFFNSSKEK